MDRLHVIKGDITKLRVDAIVNAANEGLTDGAGVNGAIHRAGGAAIREACKKIGGCKTGEAVITPGGNLAAKFVIHTVGPVWRGGTANEAALLASCYHNSLKLAVANGNSSLAFPNISTGIFGYPKTEAAAIAITAVSRFLSQNDFIDNVYFVCFDEENYQLYRGLLV